SPEEKDVQASSVAVTSSGNDWSKAEFESDERKNKFLRLMGAMKSQPQGAKGAQHQSTSPAKKSNSRIESSAINSDVSKKIQADLERQFEQGLAMRKQRFKGAGGMGLGFQS
ncbi:hypothetical protein EV182_008254, partial [Spiromyces aspiralis]